MTAVIAETAVRKSLPHTLVDQKTEARSEIAHRAGAVPLTLWRIRNVPGTIELFNRVNDQQKNE